MRAGLRVRQDVGEEDALIDLDAVLVALRFPALRIDLRARRRQAGNELRGLIGERLGAHEAGLVLGQHRIERLRVFPEKGFACLAPGVEDRVGCACLLWIALRLVRQCGEQLMALEPELRMAVGVVLEVPRDLRPRTGP
jgi:hypothetical protein